MVCTVTTERFGRHELSNSGLKEFQTMVGSLVTFVFFNYFSQSAFISSFFKILVKSRAVWSDEF